jgi:hypothetical protein
VGTLTGASGPGGRRRRPCLHIGEPLEGPVGLGISCPGSPGDLAQPRRHGGVGGIEHPATVLGEHVVDPPPVRQYGAALHQAPGDQPVDYGGDGRRPDGQPLGQVRGDGRALVQQPEDPVLGEGQVGDGQADLDLLGQPRRGPPRVRRSSTAMVSGIT